MGSGCSSPLRRFGGKRTKDISHRDSYHHGQTDDGIGSESQTHVTAHQHRPQKLAAENEITVQSEYNEDHPSSGSYLTDAKALNDESKLSEQSSCTKPVPIINSNTGCNVAITAPGAIHNGSYVPHDRHLLVSPALSPAPSICYSPSPAGSTSGNSKSLDLAELDEVFKGITFGLSDGSNQKKRFPPRNQNLQHSDLQQHARNLVQSQKDFVNSLSVVFVSITTFQQPERKPNGLFDTELLANHIETHLRTFCEEHNYIFRLINLSQEHLLRNLRVNNLIDLTKRIIDREIDENGDRILPIVLSDFGTGGSGDNVKVQLPTKIDAQAMTKLLTSEQLEENEKVKDLIKLWYNQSGGVFYLKPIYLVNPKILSDSKDERDSAWLDWLKDSTQILDVLTQLIDNQRINILLGSNTLFDSCVEFILDEPNLLKRTLLIRSPNQPSGLNGSHHLNKTLNNLNELARLLSDPNKLNIKKFTNDDDIMKSISDWVCDNFAKFFEGITDHQLSQGRHIPPFIDRNLFIELTSQRLQLESYLDKATEGFETKSQTFFNNQILPILNSTLLTSEEYSTSSDVTCSNDDQSQHNLSSNHLVFISGPKGCGKSSLLAQIIKFTAQEVSDRVQIIYRFCGVSLDSLGPNRVLRSICEQFCQTQGENITAASYIYSAKKDVMNALNKIVKLRSTVIFLDGLDQFESIESHLDWLCEFEASSSIKIFITLDSSTNLYKRALDTYHDATQISLDEPTISDWARTLSVIAKSCQLSYPGNIHDEINSLGDSSLTGARMSYATIREIINISRVRKLNNETTYPELSFTESHFIQDLDQVHTRFMNQLQYLLSPYQLCAFIAMLSSSRNGLYESDIINVMTLILKSQKAWATSESKFSNTLMSYLEIQLKPWLLKIICDRSVKLMIDRDFAKTVITNYATKKYPNIVSDIQSILLDYFNRQTKSKQSRKSKSDCDKNDQLEPSESFWLATQASEVANLLISTNKSKAREHLISKDHFYSLFLYGSMPEEFIEDCERLKDLEARKSSSNDETSYLIQFIRQSVYPLRYDGRQIYSQIYCRAFDIQKSGKVMKSKKLNDILNAAQSPPVRSLLPVSEASVNSFIRSRIGQISTPSQSAGSNSTGVIGKLSVSSQQSATARSHLKQMIFTIKDNHRHVVAIFPERGTLLVWDLYEEKAVRTISNIDSPRDLRMIDQKRAVILCNRELRVYDLDSGILLTKLKGVMNQKMPFFEIFGDNYVIALARNRMCVNMLNLNNGELETTFKVGEDRFLNSLLVSADGGVCVCGDETQKPFPLLVWNLNERRLMYDLRLERHEFITRMSAISDDGHFVVSVCKQVGDCDSSIGSIQDPAQKLSPPNFIVIYDLSSGTLFKKWKPGLDTCAVAISYCPGKSGKVVNTIEDCSILVWDLTTGSKK